MVFRARVFASYLFIFLRAVGYFNPFPFFFCFCCLRMIEFYVFSVAFRTMFRHAISILAIISYACNWTRGCNRFVKVVDNDDDAAAAAYEEKEVVNMWTEVDML